MKKLIEALHTIQDECRKYSGGNCKSICSDCPMYADDDGCAITDLCPSDWKINDEVQKALL